MIEPHFPDTAQAQEATGDRREADRIRTVWRIAKVARDDDVGLWRVRNISDQGMMLAVDVPVSVGERLEIALSESVAFRGRIVWSENGRCGVVFDDAVDGAAILKQLASEQQSGDYRPPRLPICTAAQLVTDDGASDIELADLSAQGAGFVHDGRLEVGKSLELVLASGLTRNAIVRWSRGGRGGLWLTEPLDRADLESIRQFESEKPKPKRVGGATTRI